MGGLCLLSSCFGLKNPLFWSNEFKCENVVYTKAMQYISQYAKTYFDILVYV